jgi:hypothetical protein
MIAAGNSGIIITLSLIVAISSAYAIGRIHQWNKDGLEREDAYRNGYDKASSSLMRTMTSSRSRRQVPDQPVGPGRTPRQAEPRQRTGRPGERVTSPGQRRRQIAPVSHRLPD